MVSAALLAVSMVPLSVAVATTGSQSSAARTLTGVNPRFDTSAVQAPWVTFGNDDGYTDDATVAWGTCRLAPNNTVAYPIPTAGEVDTIVHDPTNLSGASNFGCKTPQNESTVAVNPTNPLNVVAGANDYRVCCDTTGLNDGTGWAYYSFDGGHTWGNVQVPGLTAETGGQGNFKKIDSAGDPNLAFGPDGTLYYANLVFSRTVVSSGVAVSKSTDGGRTWARPVMVAFTNAPNFLNDKEWIAAGADGRVIITWTRFNQGPHGVGYIESPIVASTSTDGGATWSANLSVSDASHPYDQGSQVAYAPNGDLYVSYEAADPSTGYSTDALILAKSTDNGASFSTSSLNRVYDDNDCYPVYAGRQTLTGEHFRLNSYPSMSIDPLSGQIAIVWSDNQFAGNCGTGGSSFAGTTSNQVKIVTGGFGAMSAPRFVTAPGSADTVFPAVADRGGHQVVTFYTRAYASTHNPANCNVAIADNAGGGPHFISVASSVCLDYAARLSVDGFSTQLRLTSDGSNPYVQFADGSFIGDYTQTVIGADGVGHASWTDFRGNPGITGPNQDIYVSSTPGDLGPTG
jgi:hypothetical protein